MNLKNISLDFKSVAMSDKVIVTAVRDDMEFGTDNKPTGKCLGSRYDVVCHANGFASVTVKVPDAQLAIAQEQLDQRNAAGNFVYCSFDGFVGKIYQNFRSDNKEVRLSATAKSIQLLGTDAKDAK